MTYYKYFLATLLIIAAALGSNFSTYSDAQASAMGAQQERIALVTIRYNQKVISYKGQLYNAVTEAVKTKPTVVFDVVSYAPVGRDAKSNMKLSERAYSYGAQVAEDIKRMGVNPQQVTFSSQQDPRISFEEVRVFVR